MCGLKFPWKPLHQKPEEERKDSEYVLHYDRNSLPKNWAVVGLCENQGQRNSSQLKLAYDKVIVP